MSNSSLKDVIRYANPIHSNDSVVYFTMLEKQNKQQKPIKIRFSKIKRSNMLDINYNYFVH